jgi:hypothetical protein
MRVKIGRPLLELVRLCYAADRPLLLVGHRGVGKSELLKAAADEMNIDFLSLDLSLMEPTDLVGLPKLHRGVTRFFPPSFLPTRGRGLVVFEELNRCASYMRAPCLQLLTARRLNDYVLPAGWLPAAAINPGDGDYEASELDAALRSRFVQVEVEPDRDEWLTWARAAGVHGAVISYVASDSTVFDDADSNPRAWAYISDLLKATHKGAPSGGALRAAVVGLVGDERGAAFCAFLDRPTRPLTAEAVLNRYAERRAAVREWIGAGRLDLVRGSLLAVQKALQARPSYEEARSRAASWTNLGDFLRDLPGDLREEAERFFAERRYVAPRARRN